METCVMGIDPGLDGGIALVYDKPKRLVLEIMPTVPKENGKGRQIDLLKFASLVKSWHPTLAVVEKQGARPGQGVVSMFTCGMGYGAILGVLNTLDVSVDVIHPRRWQNDLRASYCVLEGGENPKAAALRVAEKAFPGEKFLASPRCKVPHDGLVDAALLAEWGRIRFGALL